MNLNEEELLIIKKILEEIIPEKKVIAFGSRVDGRSKEYSDLDLLILEEEKIDLKKLFEIQEKFEESDLTFRVDISDEKRISSGFLKNIMKNSEIIQNPEKQISD